MSDNVASVIIAIASSVVSVLTWISGRKMREVLVEKERINLEKERLQSKTGAVDVIDDAMARLISLYKERDESMSKKILFLESAYSDSLKRVQTLELRIARLEEIEKGARLLHKQVIDNGLIPVYTPPEDFLGVL